MVSKMVRATHNVTKFSVIVKGWKEIVLNGIVLVRQLCCCFTGITVTVVPYAAAIDLRPQSLAARPENPCIEMCIAVTQLRYCYVTGGLGVS